MTDVERPEGSTNHPLVSLSDENIAFAQAMGVNPAIHENDFIFRSVERRWAANVLTQVLAVELRERDITVNAVSVALHRPCVADRVADVVAYLVSGHGHRFTGQVFRIGDAGLRP